MPRQTSFVPGRSLSRSSKFQRQYDRIGSSARAHGDGDETLQCRQTEKASNGMPLQKRSSLLTRDDVHEALVQRSRPGVRAHAGVRAHVGS